MWLNGQLAGAHEGGHLPFHIELNPAALNFGHANTLTISVNNTLTSTTIPPGHVQTNLAGRRIQRLQFDFFNYAGLHRQVQLYTTPRVYVEDITITARLDGGNAQVSLRARPEPSTVICRPSPTARRPE